MIRLDLHTQDVINGEAIRGEMNWSSDKAQRKLEVFCRWRIESKGRDREEVVDLELDVAPESNVTIPFEFTIPRIGPLSYDGKLFRIVWEIVARADVPFARDLEEVRVFTVRPRPYDPAEWTVEEDEEEDVDDEGPGDA
jgi:hypothetical protein